MAMTLYPKPCQVAREAHLRRMVEEQLSAALNEPSIAALEQALGAAREVRLQSPKVAEAEQLLETLHLQEAAAKQLEQAVALRDVSALKTALEAAAKAKLPGPRMQQAQHLLRLLPFGYQSP